MQTAYLMWPEEQEYFLLTEIVIKIVSTDYR